jgi:hypothetical protein
MKGFGDFCGNPIGFCKNRVFLLENQFLPQKIANIFAMSAALSPWGKGFESRFLGKSEIC